MRTIIAGSRGVHDTAVVNEAMRWACVAGILPSVVLSGTARGADQLGEWWAKQRGLPVEHYPADWLKFGRAAGHRRNREMAEHADALVALWDGSSPGTQSMIKYAHELRLEVFVWRQRGSQWGAT